MGPVGTIFKQKHFAIEPTVSVEQHYDEGPLHRTFLHVRILSSEVRVNHEMTNALLKRLRQPKRLRWELEDILHPGNYFKEQ